MTTTYHLTPVAFVRTTGGRLNVLLAVDEGDLHLFDGEPALLVSHRPGAAHHELQVEGAEALDARAIDAVRGVAHELARLIEGAFDVRGEFDGQRLLGQRVPVVASAGCFALVAGRD